MHLFGLVSYNDPSNSYVFVRNPKVWQEHSIVTRAFWRDFSIFFVEIRSPPGTVCWNWGSVVTEIMAVSVGDRVGTFIGQCYWVWQHLKVHLNRMKTRNLTMRAKTCCLCVVLLCFSLLRYCLRYFWNLYPARLYLYIILFPINICVCSDHHLVQTK